MQVIDSDRCMQVKLCSIGAEQQSIIMLNWTPMVFTADAAAAA